MRRIGLVIAIATLPAGSAGAAPSLLLMPPEIAGDTSPTGPDAWNGLLDLLARTISVGIEERDVYTLADPALAEKSFDKHSHRADVFSCHPCAAESAREAHADRALSVRVFRMSELVLSMQVLIRDGETGEVRYAKSYGFRGDNERAWLDAAEHLIDGLSQIPPDLR